MTVARQVDATSEGGAHPCGQSRHMTVAFSDSYTTVHYILTHAHAALGGGGPRWQPLMFRCSHVLVAGHQLSGRRQRLLMHTVSTGQQWRSCFGCGAGWQRRGGLRTARDSKYINVIFVFAFFHDIQFLISRFGYPAFFKNVETRVVFLFAVALNLIQRFHFKNKINQQDGIIHFTLFIVSILYVSHHPSQLKNKFTRLSTLTDAEI